VIVRLLRLKTENALLNKKMLKYIIPFNKLSSNGRIYKEDSFSTIPKEGVFLFFSKTPYPQNRMFSEVVGVVDEVQKTEFGLQGKITLNDISNKEQIENLISSDQVVVRGESRGLIGEDGIVRDAILTSCNIVYKNEDAFI